MNASVKTICMTCRVTLKDGPEFPVSHGICPKCEAEWRRQAKALLAGMAKARDLVVVR